MTFNAKEHIMPPAYFVKVLHQVKVDFHIYLMLTCMHSHGISAGTVPKYPLHFWKHFFTGPATRRKGVLLTMALAGSVVVTMAFAASQHQLASQLYSMAL